MFRLEQVETLFHEALALAPEIAVARWLNERCGGDSAMRDEVLSLLEAYRAMKQAASNGDSDTVKPPASDPPRSGRFGPYRIDRLLGTGGMGAVYLARRDDGEFEQEVAIKLVGLHLAGPEFLSNFRNERQVLANLNHPNITRLLDGGVTETGDPYLVMEYVDGQPLDEYCEQRRLKIGVRLQLFLQVCQAVECAHRNLVVHRDLKPGNIFVDGTGTVKLLDFGTAKLLRDQDATVTRVGLMTPRYASPEQLRGEVVTTTCDVFSLGVILFELLAGGWPFGDPKSAIDTLDRVVRNRPATAPAAVVTDHAAEERSTIRARLKKDLTGDLSRIVLKMLEQDPAQRYGSVREVEEDIERYRSGRPILARPRTLRYTVRKFVTRHWLAVSAATLTIAALTGLTIVSLAQSARAKQQAERAERISEFVKRTFYSASSTWRSALRGQSREIQFLDVLDSATARLDKELGNDPRAEADMLGTLGMTYALLGDPERGQAQLKKAIAMLAKSGAKAPTLAAQLNAQLCDALSYASRYQEALAACQEAVKLARQAPFPELGGLLHDTAFMAVKSGGPLEDAEKLFREAQQIDPVDKTQLRMHRELISTRIASIRLRLGDLAEGERLLAEAENYLESEPGPPIEIIPTLVARAYGSRIRGDYPAAIKWLERAIALLQQRPTPYMGREQIEIELAAVQALAGQTQGLSRWRAQREALDSSTAGDRIRLEMLAGTVEGLLGDRETALQYLRDSIARSEREAPRQPADRVEAHLRLAQVLVAAGNHPEAAEVARRGLATAQQAYGSFFADHPIVRQLRALQ